MSDSQSTKNEVSNSSQDDTITTNHKAVPTKKSENLESKKEENIHQPVYGNSIDTGKEARDTDGTETSHHLSSPEGHKHGKRRGSTTVDEEIPPPPAVDKKMERTHNNLVNWAKRFSVVEEELHPVKQQRRLSVDKKVTGDKHRRQSLDEQNKEHQIENYHIDHGKKRLSLWEETPLPTTVTQGLSDQDKQKPKYQRRVSLWQEDEEKQNPNVSTIGQNFQKQETLIELQEKSSHQSKVKSNVSELQTTLRERPEKLQENKNPQTTILTGNPDDTPIFESEGDLEFKTPTQEKKVEEKNNGEEEKVADKTNGEEEKVEEKNNGEEEKVEEKNNGEEEKVAEKTNGEEEKVAEKTNGEGVHTEASKTPNIIITPNSDTETILEDLTSQEILPTENRTTTDGSQTALESNEQEVEPIPIVVQGKESKNTVSLETEEKVNGKVKQQARDLAVVELHAEAPEKSTTENTQKVVEENPLQIIENNSESTKNQFTEVDDVIEKGCNTDKKTYSDAECSQDTQISKQTERNQWNKEKWNVLLDVLSGYENIPCNKCNKPNSDDSVGSIILGTIQDLVETIAGSSTQEKAESPPPKSDAK